MVKVEASFALPAERGLAFASGKQGRRIDGAVDTTSPNKWADRVAGPSEKEYLTNYNTGVRTSVALCNRRDNGATLAEGSLSGGLLRTYRKQLS